MCVCVVALTPCSTESAMVSTVSGRVAGRSAPDRASSRTVLVVLGALVYCTACQRGAMALNSGGRSSAAFQAPIWRSVRPRAQHSGVVVSSPSGGMLGAGGRVVMGLRGKKDDDDISREFARRLEDEDEEEEAPLRRKGLDADPSPSSSSSGSTKSGVPLFTLPGTRGYSKESGNDYWIDPQLQAKEDKRSLKKKGKATPKDQFPSERIKAEIVAPYKNNWILFISITIFSIVFFGFLFPEELSQVPSIKIPDFEAIPTPFGALKQ